MNTKKPNILLLIAEDTGCHHGCYGDPIARTEAIDSLAADGRLYEQCIATAPVCAPSRCSYVTGHYAFSLGTHNMRSWTFAQPETFMEILRENGYYVNWANKQDFNFTPRDEYADEERLWFDDLAEGNLPDKPWFLYYNFDITHESYMWPSKWERGVVPHLGEGAFTDPVDVPVPEYIPDRQTSRRDIARYYDALYLQDREMRKILDALDKSGHADNTVVIYIGDHGRGLPREKRWCYDAGCHVPLIVRWPGQVEPGSRETSMISGVDIAPTILSIAGIEAPEHYQGQAFLGVHAVRDKRQYCLSARDRIDEAYDRIRTLRDEMYRYIRNYYPELPYCQRADYMEKHNTVTLMRELYAHGQLNEAQSLWFSERKPAEELYDCQADPDNVRNLADSPEHRETLERMRGALEATLAETPDLGELSERELIERGIVCDDHLKKFLKTAASLPPYQRIGPEATVVEQPESAAKT